MSAAAMFCPLFFDGDTVGVEVTVFLKNGKIKETRQFLFSNYADADDAARAAYEWEHQAFVKRECSKAARRATFDKKRGGAK